MKKTPDKINKALMDIRKIIEDNNLAGTVVLCNNDYNCRTTICVSDTLNAQSLEDRDVFLEEMKRTIAMIGGLKKLCRDAVDDMTIMSQKYGHKYMALSKGVPTPPSADYLINLNPYEYTLFEKKKKTIIVPINPQADNPPTGNSKRDGDGDDA